MRNFPRVSRSAPTDRIPAVRDVAARPRTLRLPVVMARRSVRHPELREVEVSAAHLLHSHLLDVIRTKRTTDSDLAGALERAGCWPLEPPGPLLRGFEHATGAQWRLELRAALRPVLDDARTWWTHLPEPGPCEHCGYPRDGDLCAFHRRQRYEERDVLEGFARRIVNDVPVEAAEGMRES